ncbi:KUP/HAK/KT family potassium transporter, partial [Serratia marcescens]
CFFVVDLSFLTANLTKVLQGGYIPLLLAAAVYTVMLIWHRGVLAAVRTLGETTVPIADFLAKFSVNPCRGCRAPRSFSPAACRARRR